MSFITTLVRTILSRPGRARRFWITVLCALALAGAAHSARPAWRTAAPLPEPRTEVTAAAVGGRIAVVGGFTFDGQPSPEAWLYDPGANRWSPLPDLPRGAHHAMAAAFQGRLYVIGGYVGPGQPSRDVYVLAGRASWRPLPRLPEPRAAAGAAVAAGRLYVVGGVGPAGLARRAYVLDLRRSGARWRTIPGPRPREHLAVTALGGRVFALAGRLAGIDTNLRLLQSYAAGARRWTTLPPVPQSRGGTGAAAVGNEIVSVGGEEPAGTIATVFAYNVKTRRWRRLPDLPTPRHGLGVTAAGGEVYAVSGGPRPGLFVSTTNEVLRLR